MNVCNYFAECLAVAVYCRDFQVADAVVVFCLVYSFTLNVKEKSTGKACLVLFSLSPSLHRLSLIHTTLYIASFFHSLYYITHSFTPPKHHRIHTYKMLASILFALLPLVSAIVTPTTPDGSTVINEGGSIDAAWTADDTGSWTNMTIQLMTGDNLSVSSEYNGARTLC